ncbi:MAG TPA: response regulator [Rhodopila sp.]|jgi:CheY-like chemotaxis protein|nr:response regulator [Rhodopila sp.]
MQRLPDKDQPLRGTRILVVDDEFLIAAALEDALRDAGSDTVCALTLAAALECAGSERLSAAVLDVRLGRHSIEPVADALAARQVPFMFYTGQALPEQLCGKYPHTKVLLKPAKQNMVVQAMLKVTVG